MTEIVKSAVAKPNPGRTWHDSTLDHSNRTTVDEIEETHSSEVDAHISAATSSAKLNSKGSITETQISSATEKNQACPENRCSSHSRRRDKPLDFGITQQQPGCLGEEEVRLREQIKSMKINLEEDAGVLGWDEVFGLASVKIALEEFATFFLNFPHLTRKLRHYSTTGILLFGPQGTGKTLLIKSFAVRFNLALYDIRASAIMSKYVGESEKFIKALFAEVRANSPAILMFDECDGLLCNPNADSTQSHHYRLLQNELKNQWSDLVYSREEVIVVGATNKPHDIDMDGFGRRLSLKLHVELPNEHASRSIIKAAMARVVHTIDEAGFEALGNLCYDRGLSGYDVDCFVEAQLRKAIRKITLAKAFRKLEHEDNTLVVPCEMTDSGAHEGPWTQLAADPEQISYLPFSFEEIKEALQQARPTVDAAMIQKHIEFASQFGTNLD